MTNELLRQFFHRDTDLLPQEPLWLWRQAVRDLWKCAFVYAVHGAYGYRGCGVAEHVVGQAHLLTFMVILCFVHLWLLIEAGFFVLAMSQSRIRWAHFLYDNLFGLILSFSSSSSDPLLAFHILWLQVWSIAVWNESLEDPQVNRRHLFEPYRTTLPVCVSSVLPKQVRNKLQQNLYVDDLNHIPHDLGIDQLFDCLCVILLMQSIMRHLLVEQVQESTLDLWEQVNVLLHELIWLWLVDEEDMRSQITDEIEIQCMLLPLQLWYFGLVVNLLSVIDFSASSRSWISHELMRIILMLQLLVVHDLFTGQDHLRWLTLIRLWCFHRVDALGWIRRRIWSTRRSVRELWLER